MPAESSLKLYRATIERIRNGCAEGTDGLAFLGNHTQVISHIETLPIGINTRKSYYIAIVSSIKNSIGDVSGAPLADALSHYNTKMLSYRDQHNAIAVQQKLSPREAELFVEWPNVCGGLENLYKDISSLWEHQDYVIYCLYTMIPPLRLDFAPMSVVSSPADVSGNGNYLIWDEKPRFYLQSYKTQAKYGSVYIDISPALEEVLEEWLALNQSGTLLLNYAGDAPMNESGLCSRVREVFKKACGKELGVSMLRHSYVTWQRRGELPMLEQQQMAAAMCHSSAMNQMYRRI